MDRRSFSQVHIEFYSQLADDHAIGDTLFRDNAPGVFAYEHIGVLTVGALLVVCPDLQIDHCRFTPQMRDDDAVAMVMLQDIFADTLVVFTQGLQFYFGRSRKLYLEPLICSTAAFACSFEII